MRSHLALLLILLPITGACPGPAGTSDAGTSDACTSTPPSFSAFAG